MRFIHLLIFTLIFGMLPVYSELPSRGFLRIFQILDKKSYFSDEDIVLKICIKNISKEKQSITIYDCNKCPSSNYTTFQPVIYDMQGREAEIIVPYKLENRALSEVIKELEPRQIQLAPNEMFIYSVNIKTIYNLKEKSDYRVKSFFFPDFKENKVILSDNELKFKIAKTRIDIKRLKKKGREIANTPIEIILLILNAEKSKKRDRFVKYINIEKFINSYSNYIGKYNRADDEEKLIIEKDFIKFLLRDRHDYILDYHILREEIDTENKTAYVNVIVDRFGVKITDRYKYRYTLEKAKNLWLVTDLEATIMKGIRR